MTVRRSFVSSRPRPAGRRCAGNRRGRRVPGGDLDHLRLKVVAGEVYAVSGARRTVFPFLPFGRTGFSPLPDLPFVHRQMPAGALPPRGRGGGRLPRPHARARSPAARARPLSPRVFWAWEARRTSSSRRARSSRRIARASLRARRTCSSACALPSVRIRSRSRRKSSRSRRKASSSAAYWARVASASSRARSWAARARSSSAIRSPKSSRPVRRYRSAAARIPSSNPKRRAIVRAWLSPGIPMRSSYVGRSVSRSKETLAFTIPGRERA